MAAHRNITTALPSGITLHADAEADDVQITSTVEIAELVEQNTGHIILANPVNIQRKELAITGDGPADFAGVAAGVIGTIGNFSVTKLEIEEAPNQRCRFSLAASASAALVDPAAEPEAAGAEPGIEDLEIVSVAYAIAEGVRRSAEAEYHVLVGSDGTPAHAARETVKNPFEIRGRGDLPAGVALGTGGAAYSGSDSGLTIVGSLMTGEKRKDWNRWSASGTNYPEAGGGE
jgi:hypothetical protein